VLLASGPDSAPRNGSAMRHASAILARTSMNSQGPGPNRLHEATISLLMTKRMQV